MSSFHHSMVLVCVVLVAHNFNEMDCGHEDYSYLAFGELSRIVYCVLSAAKA